MSSTPRALSGVAFTTLLVIALMMGANHVAARFAFNSGVDVVTAISVRSLVTAFAVGLIVWQQRVPLALSLEHKRHLPAIGVLIAIQSFCLYSAVARLPVPPTAAQPLDAAEMGFEMTQGVGLVSFVKGGAK